MEHPGLFIPDSPNDELGSRLPAFYLFAALPESALEPLLSALPVIINRRRRRAVARFTYAICVLVDNTPDVYRTALQNLIGDRIFRGRFGQRRRRHSRCSPRLHPRRMNRAAEQACAR